MPTASVFLDKGTERKIKTSNAYVHTYLVSFMSYGTCIYDA